MLLDFNSDHGIFRLTLARWRHLPVLAGVVATAGNPRTAAQPGDGMLSCRLIDQPNPHGGSCSIAKCAAANQEKPFPPELGVFLVEPQQFSAFLTGQRPMTELAEYTAINAGLAHPFGHAAHGHTKPRATAVQVRPSARQRATASYFCWSVNRRRTRLGLVKLVINPQSGGHGVSPFACPPNRGKLTRDGRLHAVVKAPKVHVPAKVQLTFRVIKQQFGFKKTRLRGLAKNRCKINVLAAQMNVYLARIRLPIAA